MSTIDSQSSKLELTPERACELIKQGYEARIQIVEDKLYVPGHFECKKCGFHLVSKTLYMQSGTVGANNKSQECSNGCGPMWRVSWQDHANKLQYRLEALAERAVGPKE